MKDLYRRNKLRPRESDRIRIHNSEGSEEEKEAAFTILLNPEKKAEYDRVHLALSTIGYVRRHLGLAGRSNWRIRYGDFLDPTEYAAFKPRQPKTPARRSRFHWLKPLLGWPLITTALVVLLMPLAHLALTLLERSRTALPPGFDQAMYAVASDVPVFARPSAAAVRLAELVEFQDVSADLRQSSGDWLFVKVDSDHQGYVRREHLAPGVGEVAQLEKCRSYGTWRPESGQHLAAGKTGRHILLVDNPPGRDALVKLKDHEGQTQVFFYVRSGETVAVNTIPEGRFQIHYALGNEFSPACGRFLDGMQARVDPRFITFAGEPERRINLGEHTSKLVANREF